MNSKNKPSEQENDFFWDFLAPIGLTFLLYFGIRTYIAEARYIPSGSMLPGLQIKDRLIIEKITLKRRSPKRGEIVVFNSPFSFDPVLNAKKLSFPFKCTIINFPFLSSLIRVSDPSCDAYIKRVVGIAGDKILINSKGQIKINGKIVQEPYVRNYCLSSININSNCPSINRKIPMDHVFVLGDNRSNSWDGRFWPGGGFLPVKEIFGRAVWRFWPLNRIGRLSFKTTQNYFA